MGRIHLPTGQIHLPTTGRSQLSKGRIQFPKPVMMLCVSQVPLVQPRLTSMATQMQGSKPDKSIREVQLTDAMIGSVLRAKEQGKPPTAELTTASNHHTCQLVQQWDQLTIKDGVLYRNFESNVGTKHTLQMFIPSQLQEKVLREVHEGRLSGHLRKPKHYLGLKNDFTGLEWQGVRVIGVEYVPAVQLVKELAKEDVELYKI